MRSGVQYASASLAASICAGVALRPSSSGATGSVRLARAGEGLETPEGSARGAGCEGEAPGGVIGGVKVGLLPPTASS